MPKQATGSERPAIPEADFINARYDVAEATETTDLLVILSTPRSGSTLLCDHIYRHGLCLPHEYFQPFQYMPALAERWDAREDGETDLKTYVRQLRKFRTFPNGWLGVNLHAKHLQIWIAAQPHLQNLRQHYVHVLRRDQIAQAVSYHIASQTRQWSSQFERQGTPEYDFNKIRNRLSEIQMGNTAIEAFLRTRELDSETVYYEDLVQNPASELKKIEGMPREIEIKEAGIERQAGALSQEFADRFSRDLMEAFPVPADSKTPKRLSGWASRHIPGFWRLSRRRAS